MEDETPTRSAESTSTGSVEQEPRLSTTVVIPTYNERENILPVIEQCQAALQHQTSEIIVVDDDSPDRTWAVVRAIYLDDPDVRAVRRESESGLATAIVRGFRESTKETCIVIDADLQHPPEKIPELIAELDEGADIVVGSRYHPVGHIEGWSRTRRLVSRGATRLAQVLLPSARATTDPVSGFFAVRADRLKGTHLAPRGYKILLEVLVRCDWEMLTEVPYVFTERDQGDSNLTFEEYVNFLEHLAQLSILDHDADTYVDPTRAVRAIEFGLVGATGVVVNTIVFLAAHVGLSLHYLLAGTVAFLTAVNWNFLGNWALTFDQSDGDRVDQYVSFHGVSLGGFVVYSSILYLTLELLHTPVLVGNTIAIGIGAVVNFLGAEHLVFLSNPLLGTLRERAATVKSRVETTLRRWSRDP